VRHGVLGIAEELDNSLAHTGEENRQFALVKYPRGSTTEFTAQGGSGIAPDATALRK
jgi:hypothetical protein